MADLQRGITYGVNEQITNTKLHNLIDLSSIKSNFITDKTAVTPVSGDSIVLSDASDSGALKKCTFGDVSTLVSASVTGIVGSTQITANTVTLDRVQQISNLRLLANFAGSTGNVQSYPIGNGLQFSAGSVQLALGTGLAFNAGSVEVSSSNFTSKAWARVNVSAGVTVQISQNISNATYHGSGTTCLYFSTPFTNGTSYGGNVSLLTSGNFNESVVASTAAGSALIVTRNNSDVSTDAPYFVTFYGL